MYEKEAKLSFPLVKFVKITFVATEITLKSNLTPGLICHACKCALQYWLNHIANHSVKYVSVFLA